MLSLVMTKLLQLRSSFCQILAIARFAFNDISIINIIAIKAFLRNFLRRNLCKNNFNKCKIVN